MATHRSKNEYIAALEKRVADLSLAIEDIERRRRSEPDREHPSQKYIDELRFELRSYRVKLEAQRRGDEQSTDGDDKDRVVSLDRFRGKDGMSRSSATDHRLRWNACRRFTPAKEPE